LLSFFLNAFIELGDCRSRIGKEIIKGQNVALGKTSCMKKQIKQKVYPNRLFILTALLVFILPHIGCGQFIFTTNNGAITITGDTNIPPDGMVFIPSSTNGYPVVAIGNAAFSVSSLTSVTIPNSVTSIGYNAFILCQSLTNVDLGSGLTNLGSEAFDFCTSLPRITIPDSVATIGSNAFISCFSLTNAVIGSGLTNLGGEAFDQCTNLQGVTVNPTNPAYSSLNGVLFDKGQTLLIQYPPAKAATTYSIPASVVNIGTLAFDSCANLINITIPSGVVTIGNNAFNKCFSLAGITIPNTIASIGSSAFYDCTNLTTIALPSSVTNIGTLPFGLCLNLSAITVDAGNPDYSSTNGVLFDKNQTMFIQFPEGKAGHYMVPATVINITDSTFAVCLELTSVTIPNSVTNIGFDAFGDDLSLTNVTIPNSVTSIGELAFDGCLSLTSVTIGNGVTNIGTFAFYGCTGLTNAIFNGNAPTMGFGVFLSDASGFTVEYYDGATGFATPDWTDSSGDNYPAVAIVQTTGAPLLTITYSGNQAIVAWPASVTGWTLQTNNNLGAGTWGNYAGTIANNSVTNSQPNGNLYFRLKQP
jgi:hypothetical protein